MDRAENVCSDPEILAEEIEHLSRVLCYNNYPQWMIDKWGKSDKIVVIVPLLVLEVLKYFFGFLVDICTVLSYGILTKLITDSFGSCNVLSEGNFGRTYSKLGALL